MGTVPPVQAPEPGPVTTVTKFPVWIIAVVVSVCGVGCFAILAAILLPVFDQARIASVRTQCMKNQKTIATSLLIYTSDYDQCLPKAEWMDSLTRVYGVREAVLHCPAVVRGSPQDYGYALNSNIAGKRVSGAEDAKQTPLLFDSSLLQQSAVGSTETLPRPPRHGSHNVIAYLDGHVGTKTAD